MKPALLSSYRIVLTLLSLVHNVQATMRFSLLQAGATLSAASPIAMKWENIGLPDHVLNKDIRFSLFLCAGGNDIDSQEELATLIDYDLLAYTNSVSANIDQGIGGEHANAYFLRMVLEVADLTLVVHSDRFSLTDMTGSFSPSVSAGLQSISNSEGPPPYNELGRRQAPHGALHDVPYPDQTGDIRYAPMPKPAGSKITKESAKPLHPPSPYHVATTFLPAPAVETTISATPAQTVKSIENTVAAAPDPKNDMEKFLNRWKD